MGIESFDNKIKDKLQQYSSEYTERDWNDFAPLLRAQNSWWRRNRESVAYGTAALIILLLGFQNYHLWQKNNEFQNLVAISHTSKPEAGIFTTTIRDTIYIVKNNYLYHNGPSATTSSDLTRIETNKSFNSTLRNTGKNQPANVDTAPGVIVADKTPNPTEAEKLKQEPEGVSVISAEGKDEKQAEDLAQSAENLADSLKTPLRDTSTLFSTASEKLTPIPAMKTPLNTLQPKRYYFAAGLSSMRRHDFIAAGPSFLFSKGRHFQASVGLQFGQGFHEEYRDNDEFRAQHLTDFREKFSQPVPVYIKFTDIHSRTHQWSVPLTLYYKYPLNRRIDVFAGAGTTIDLFATQNFAYQYTENGNSPQSGKLPIQQSGLRLNHLQVSAGAQVNVKAFIVRAEPLLLMDNYAERQMKEQRAEPGFRASVLYRF